MNTPKISSSSLHIHSSKPRTSYTHLIALPLNPHPLINSKSLLSSLDSSQLIKTVIMYYVSTCEYVSNTYMRQHTQLYASSQRHTVILQMRKPGLREYVPSTQSKLRSSLTPEVHALCTT